MNVVITGASRGIGFEAAKILSKNHRVLALSRNVLPLKKLKAGERNDFSNLCGIEILKFDITDKKDLLHLAAFAKQHFSCVDVLINNAGHLVKKPFEKFSESDLRATFETNFFGVIWLTRILLPFLKRSVSPHIVNIGSMGGFQGSAKFPGLSIYSSSKAALVCLSECLAEEFREKKIAVNCLALGAAQTEMLSEAFPGYKAPLSARQMAEFIAEFSVTGQNYFNGKVLPVSRSTP